MYPEINVVSVFDLPVQVLFLFEFRKTVFFLMFKRNYY